MGIGNGDEVIVPSLTFVATSNTAIHVGAKPVFAEIDKDTFNLDPESLKDKITKKTKAVIPVHLYGQSCDMDEINEIAEKHNLKVIEDSAQAMGARYKDKKTGSFGNAGSFSFHPIKNMVTGEGGMITTNDEGLSKKIRTLKNHGMDRNFTKTKNSNTEREFIDIGYNFRLPEINSVLGISQLKDVEKNNNLRVKKARLYNELLSKIRYVKTPYVKTYNKHTYSAYTIKCKSRDKLMKLLRHNNISCFVRHPPVHLEPIYKKLFKFKKGYLPITEAISNEILSLPMFPSLPEETIHFVCDKIKQFYSS